jgi:hypothetical protein
MIAVTAGQAAHSRLITEQRQRTVDAGVRTDDTRNRHAHALDAPHVMARIVRVEKRFSWKRVAKILNIEVGDVQRLISLGQLKLVDTFVTDRAFEEFCTKYGGTINLALIDASTRKWLITEYGVQDHVESEKIPRAQKHALILRACKCGQKIAGNVFSGA